MTLVKFSVRVVLDFAIDGLVFHPLLEFTDALTDGTHQAGKSRASEQEQQNRSHD